MTFKLFLLYIFVVVFLCLQNVTLKESESCPQSISTETIVEKCPVDSSEWIRAKERKQCHMVIQHCTATENFQYHCLPNKFLDVLVEVCTSTKVIVGQNCPYYDLQRKTIVPNFNQPCQNECPNVYSSSQAYKYQTCYEEVKEKETKQVTPENRSSQLSLEVSESYPELAIGIYMICGLLIVVVILIIIRLYCLYPCLGKCPCKRLYRYDKRKYRPEKDAEMEFQCKEECLRNGS